MGRRRTWTMAELKSAKERSAQGETWDSIAKDFKVAASTVRKQVRTHLGPVESRPRRPYRDGYEHLLIQAVALRNSKQLSWPLIAKEIEWPASAQALFKATHRYAKEHNINLIGGFPTTRRTKWDNR